ncbi:MAG: 5-methyltetrahydropteroyltriglutamate--homocysteine S-methyltransferase [Lentisphaeria bacterium]|nr:5-methyltetrahydropteroyltriglutamate--homocysteine S-methyltransferase [Lentisphaeria bacterium]
MVKTHNLGYPRIGEKRELKRATEAYWKGTITVDELQAIGKEIRVRNWKKQQEAGIDLIPVNDFSFYDQVLDMSCLLGNIPPRFKWNGDEIDIKTIFTVARGTQDGISQINDEKDCQTSKISTFASEMTKWFDTNYHYIVPEFRTDTTFSLSSSKVFDEFQEAKELGFNAKPVLIGPITYLSLGKVQDSQNPDFDPFSLLDDLLSVYEAIIQKLDKLGAEWIQIDEPIVATDLSEQQTKALTIAYERLNRITQKSQLLLSSYFGGVRENLKTFVALPVQAIHVDIVRGAEDLEELLKTFPENKILSLGIVEGRNIWRNDFEKSLSILEQAKKVVGDRLWIAPSCSLIHVPVTLANEKKLDIEVKSWLAFADEKLHEIASLSKLLSGSNEESLRSDNRTAAASRRTSQRIHNPIVKKRVEQITDNDFNRSSSFQQRQEKQFEKLNLPEFPTTTIGSFPQTNEVRKARSKWKKGELSHIDYDAFLKEETAKCISFQDDIDIDMLVHGEFERNDMVEYFGEQLDGFEFTSFGWVQSYGSRYVKPPIIYGDVSRPKAMTVYWSKYAQSLTSKPMKGMLTGPVTILQWSFVRDDQPRALTTHQIALAIRDEVVDLEAAGIAAIQIDEPAFREGLPLRKSDWQDYLHWAVNTFRLSASGVQDDTQIHTHMCYSEFNDIIEAIAQMDADVITIETSRSNMELLDAFVDFKYPNEIGPGVYDIHSPRVPQVNEMVNLLQKAEAVLPRRSLWVNPDCGLKTRQWAEVKPSLTNMVEVAKAAREQLCNV